MGTVRMTEAQVLEHNERVRGGKQVRAKPKACEERSVGEVYSAYKEKEAVLWQAYQVGEARLWRVVVLATHREE